MPHPPPASYTPEEPDWAFLRAQMLADARRYPRPKPADQQALEARIFDLRRTLVRALSAPPQESQAAQQVEDRLHDALPALAVSLGPYRPINTPVRTAAVAVLGLLWGSALAQGLVALMAGTALHYIICGIGGIAAALWLADTIAAAPGTGRWSVKLFSLPWKPLRRWTPLLALAVLALTLVRDFWRGTAALADVLDALNLFLAQGNTLALWTNIYTALGLLTLFVVCALRPTRLDAQAFADQGICVAKAWWGGALCAATAFAEQDAQRQDKGKQWRQAGADLCSFAAELPPDRRSWMEERLRRIGFTRPKQEGPLRWEAALTEQYEVLGHLEHGDACFVDNPPLYENDVLLRKGTLRKIRG